MTLNFPTKEFMKKNYQLKIKEHSELIKKYRIISLIVLSIVWAINIYIGGFNLLLTILKYFTFWGAVIVTIYFILSLSNINENSKLFSYFT